MQREEEKFLKGVVEKAGFDFSRIRKRSYANPLEFTMFRHLVDASLAGLSEVAIKTMDWKLTGIVKLLQSWINEKTEELGE
jgi:hypothetical protein